MTDSMVARVAKALWADRYPDDEWNEIDKRDYCGHARAAIEAMREPTPAILATHKSMAGDELCWNADEETCARVWGEFIDAALME